MSRRIAVILGLLTCTCAATALVACSSNNGGGGGEDAGADHTSSTDASTGADHSTNDNTDSGSGGDGTAGETGTAEGGEDGGEAGDGGGGDASRCAVYDASALNEASVQAGFIQVWQVYKCWHCHQNPTDLVDDAGNGILLNGNTVGLGDSGTTFPPNLTNSVPALGCWSDPQIETAILDGLDPEGGSLCPSMPVFGTGTSAGRPMDAGTAQEIIDYLRSLPPSNQTVPDTTCSSPQTDGGEDGAADAAQDAAEDATQEAGQDAGEDAPQDGPDAG